MSTKRLLTQRSTWIKYQYPFRSKASLVNLTTKIISTKRLLTQKSTRIQYQYSCNWILTDIGLLTNRRGSWQGFCRWRRKKRINPLIVSHSRLHHQPLFRWSLPRQLLPRHGSMLMTVTTICSQQWKTQQHDEKRKRQWKRRRWNNDCGLVDIC